MTQFARISRNLLGLVAALTVEVASAQALPAKPLRIIVPIAPGGLVDLIARAASPIVSGQIGQPVLVENRPGAATFIGMSACETAAPDGSTVCLTTSDSLVLNPLQFSKLPYDAENGFSFVTVLVRTFGVLAANSALPAASVPELIAHARTNPGTLNWATWGPASISAIYYEWFKRENGLAITSIPYKGLGPAIPALASNEVQLSYSAIGLALPHVKAGKMKFLAVTGAKRLSFLPEVPSLAEYNSDPGLTSYFGMYAPAKTPGPVTERLSAEFTRAMNTPKLREFVASQYLEAMGYTPSEFAAFHKTDRENAARIFKALGIKPSDSPPN